jgi:hypothetical protein
MKIINFFIKCFTIDFFFSLITIIVSTIFVSLPLIILYLLLDGENFIKILNLLISLDLINISLTLGIFIILFLFILFYEIKNSPKNLKNNLYLFNEFVDPRKLEKVQIHILSIKRRLSFLLIPNLLLIIILLNYFSNVISNNFFMIICFGILIFFLFFRTILKFFVLFQVQKGLLPIYIAFLRNILIFSLVFIFLFSKTLAITEVLICLLGFSFFLNYLRIHVIIKSKIF